MNLRFKIKQVDVVYDMGGNPILCGETATSVPAGLDVKVYVDSQLISSTANVDTTPFAPTVPPIVTTTANGIDVTSISTETSNTVVKVGIDVPNLWDKVLVRVVGTKTGYRTIDKTIEVFGYDLGNNAAVNNALGNPVDYNYDVEFIMVEDVVDTVTYASFIGWRKPFVDCAYVYKSSSALSTTVEYSDVAGLVVSNNADAILSCSTGEDFIQTLTLSRYLGLGCGSTLLDTCATGTQNIEVRNYIPEFGFNVVCKSGCCPLDCIVTTDDNVLKPVVDYSGMADIFIDDDVAPPFDTIDMVTEIIDCEGTIVFTDTTVIDTTLPLDVSTVEVPFTIPSKGDYLIKVVFKNDALECTKVQKVEGCEQYYIEKVDCNQYKACVYKIGDVGTKETLTINKLNASKEFAFHSTVEVDWCSCADITFTEDGVYQFVFDNGSNPLFFIVVVDCAWKACLLDKMCSLACKDKQTCTCLGECGCGTKEPKDLYDFNAVMTLTYAYMSLLNNEYLNNYIYSVFDPNKLDELYDIQVFLDRVVEYCASCDSTSTNVNTSSTNCGCSK